MPEGFLTITLTSKGLIEAITGLDLLDNSLKDMRDLKRQFDGVLDERRSALVDVTPVGEQPTKDGARMKDSWGIESNVEDYKYGGSVFNTSPHAAFVIEGTGEFGPSEKGSGQTIVAQEGRPFVFFGTKLNRKIVAKTLKGQGANSELNDLLKDSEGVLRATDRVLRGEVERIFESQVSPGVIVHGG